MPLFAVTSNVPSRYRGFLASLMPEFAPGVYIGPKISAGVRERAWNTLSKWWMSDSRNFDGYILFVWENKQLLGGIEMRYLGIPKKEVQNLYGIYCCRKDL